MTNSKIRQSAKGEECQVRIDGICNHNPETTVLAHRGGGGMGRKQPDIFGAYCCSSCHDVIDGRVMSSGHTWNEIYSYFHEGIFRTQQILLDKGLIKL